MPGRLTLRFRAAVLWTGALALAAGAAGAQDGSRTDDAAPRVQALARAERARAIVDRVASDASARGLQAWQRPLLERLLPLDDASLQFVEQQAFSLASVTAAIDSASETATLIGDPQRDVTFTPVEPCRFIDTRNSGGKISGVRAYDADLSGAAHGGSGACNLKTLLQVSSANVIAAVAMNVTIVDTSTAPAPGYLAVKPTALSPTTSLLNWHVSAAGVQVANQGVVAFDQAGATEFVIETSGAVHVIVDVFGAYLEPWATSLQVTTTSSTATVPNLANGFAAAACPAGYKLVAGGCDAFGNGNHYLSTSTANGSAWICGSRNVSGSARSLYAYARCARVPGR